MTTDTDELTLHQILEKVERYHTLKTAYVMVDPRTGERLDSDEHKREVSALNKEIKEYMQSHNLEVFQAEGLPDLKLSERTEYDVDVPALLDTDPDIFYALVAARQLVVGDVKKAKGVLNPEQQGRLRVIENKGAVALVFGRPR